MGARNEAFDRLRSRKAREFFKIVAKEFRHHCESVKIEDFSEP